MRMKKMSFRCSDFTTGILQTIGFKEFNEYLSCEKNRRDTDEGLKLLQNGTELLKIATKQYAKRQIRWIQNRFLKNTGRKVPPIYGLDVTNLTDWEKSVHEKAVHVVESHLEGRKPLIEPLPTLDDNKTNNLKCYPCDVCKRVLMGEVQWMKHIKGNKHRAVLRKLDKVEKSPEKMSEGLPSEKVIS